jgi:hypothetical protein
MSNITSQTIYYFKLFICFFLLTVSFALIKWLLFGSGSLWQGIRLTEGAMLAIFATYIRGPRFARIPWCEYWPVKILKKLSK